ncbi:hypothetical protein NFI96_010574, partial [Prochilodus magdalenae]
MKKHGGDRANPQYFNYCIGQNSSRIKSTLSWVRVSSAQALGLKGLVLRSSGPASLITPTTVGHRRSTSYGKSCACWQSSLKEEEKPPLAELRYTIRKKLKTLRRAEWHRRRRMERARKRSSFLANPFGFTRRLLEHKRSGHLECSQEEVDFLHSTLSDPDREQELGPQRALQDMPVPTIAFNISVPTWKEVQEVIRAARASSSPGPSQVPYK